MGKKKNKKKLEKSKFVFTKESLKKKFRWSEFLAEKIISSVAFLSITFIILIFIFVFRETLPLFNIQKHQQNTEVQQASDSDLRPATYGNEEDAELKPERYGAEEESEESSAEEDVIIESEHKNVNPQAAVKTLSSKDWQPVSDNPRYGLLPLLIGTLKITLISMLFAAPLGILAALFSSAFSPRWLRELIKPAVELLAGFPSVVIGFFALITLATFFQDLIGYSSRLNAFVGGIAMALAAIPIIYTITEDALTAIPKSYKEASLALGASKWQTALFVTLPAATPGIFAAILLGTGRVFGETMIVLMASGNASMMSMNPFESVRTFAATIGAEMGEVVFGDTHYSVLFLIGSLLFIFTFAINAIAEFYVKGKLLKKIQGA